eukprot:COSAG06_NODE_1689_length_8706_cov_7.834669_5_plen_96_part_00
MTLLLPVPAAQAALLAVLSSPSLTLSLSRSVSLSLSLRCDLSACCLLAFRGVPSGATGKAPPSPITTFGGHCEGGPWEATYSPPFGSAGDGEGSA